MKFTQENVALSALAHRMNLVRWRWIQEVPPDERKNQQDAARRASKAGEDCLKAMRGKHSGYVQGAAETPTSGPWCSSPESLFEKTIDGFFIVPENALLWIPGQLDEARAMGSASFGRPATEKVDKR